MAKVEKLEGIKKTEQYLTNLFRARFPFVYIPTWEEIRIVELITKIAESKAIKTKREIFIWSSTEGLKKHTEDGQEKININEAQNPISALSYIEDFNKPAILILKDVHSLLGAKGGRTDYDFIRKVRDVAGFLGLAGVIYFCYWWHKKFSYADTRLNSSNWKQQAWWWTLDGWQFEHEVARVFRLNGFKATVTKGSGDGGVDIILKKDNYRAIVQCKHHQYPLSPEPVRALWGIKDDWGADEVIMVASSGLTSASFDFVRNKPNYKVLNLDDIIRMSQCEEVQQPKIVQEVNTSKKPAITGRKVDF